MSVGLAPSAVRASPRRRRRWRTCGQAPSSRHLPKAHSRSGRAVATVGSCEKSDKCMDRLEAEGNRSPQPRRVHRRTRAQVGAGAAHEKAGVRGRTAVAARIPRTQGARTKKASARRATAGNVGERRAHTLFRVYTPRCATPVKPRCVFAPCAPAALAPTGGGHDSILEGPLPGATESSRRALRSRGSRLAVPE
jgi:hypothetical protein